jgi:hypothetical protein
VALVLLCGAAAAAAAVAAGMLLLLAPQQQLPLDDSCPDSDLAAAAQPIPLLLQC